MQITRLRVPCLTYKQMSYIRESCILDVLHAEPASNAMVTVDKAATSKDANYALQHRRDKKVLAVRKGNNVTVKCDVHIKGYYEQKYGLLSLTFATQQSTVSWREYKDVRKRTVRSSIFRSLQR